MSEYSKSIRLEIDTTMMEDTEIRIIESHIEAIRRVASGAQPQGQPEPAPVPEWRRLVDEAIRYWPHPLATVLSSLANIDGYEVEQCDDDLARIVAVCEQQVGDGWQADPDRTHSDDPENYERGWLGLALYMLADFEGRILWEEVGDVCAGWLQSLTEGSTE